MRFTEMGSPIGTLLLAADDEGLRFVGLPDGKGVVTPAPDWVRDDAPLRGPAPLARDAGAHLDDAARRPHDAGAHLDDARRQLGEYFAGARRAFELRLAPRGTEFQRLVWFALAEIPYGATWSYAELARRVGRPKAVRAVGAANGANPLPIVLPCHRVIGADGSLVGYGGGLSAKRFLLDLEGR